LIYIPAKVKAFMGFLVTWSTTKSEVLSLDTEEKSK
jgi:hypothetical protein